jgi:hypothetical protein
MFLLVPAIGNGCGGGTALDFFKEKLRLSTFGTKLF